MKIAFLGDSITEGAGATNNSKRYSTVLCKMLGAEELNYGISGTRIARQKKPSEVASFDKDFNMRALEMKDADFAFVFGGTNDFGHGDADFGNDSDTDVYTFCGALNTLTKFVLNKYGKDKFCYILPMPRFGQENKRGEGRKEKEGEDLATYKAKIKEIAQKSGIDVIDFADEFPVPKTNTGDKYTADGLHPNDYGHNLIAQRLYDYLKKRGF